MIYSTLFIKVEMVRILLRTINLGHRTLSVPLKTNSVFLLLVLRKMFVHVDGNRREKVLSRQQNFGSFFSFTSPFQSSEA